MAQPKALAADVSLPLSFERSLLFEPAHDANWVATRLGTYANLENLAELVKRGLPLGELSDTLLKVVSFPCFTGHMVDTCALFIERLIAQGDLDRAVGITIAVANGPHPSEVRAQFKVFAERMGAPPELLRAAG